MASTSEISALSVRLLLLALLSLTPTGAGADRVRWGRCRYWGLGTMPRVLTSSLDNDATTLLVAGCNINEIRRRDFEGLPNMDIIFIDVNDIVLVDWAAFSPVSKLTELYLSNNKLRELPVLDAPSLFPSLTTLGLSSNQLTSLPHARTFSTFPQLKALHLESNQLEHLHPQLFWPLTHLVSINLANNKLTYIPSSMFITNSKLADLYLDNNRLSYMPLNFASELNNAGVRPQSFSFYGNPWHCTCLLQLLADAKRVGVTYYRYDSRFTGKLPECVYSGAHPCSRHAPSGLLSAPRRAPASSSNSP